MFGLWRSLRRRRYLKKPVPAEWLGYLETHVAFFAELEGADRERFLDNLRIFLAEKYFIEAGGMVISDEVKVVVAAAAVRLIHHLGIDYYNRLTEIIVYPTHYQHNQNDAVVFGEAHDWGTVVLSWEAVLHGLGNATDGHDTATHEFAHVLDRNDGTFDGTPELRASEHYRAWGKVMTHHFTRLRQRKKKERRALRRYGATNEAEFFAVATESFFEKPRQLLEQTPELYDELKRFYGFDPVAQLQARKRNE